MILVFIAVWLGVTALLGAIAFRRDVERRMAEAERDQVRDEIATLAPYREIRDAHAEAARVLEAGENERQRLLQEATAEIVRARHEADLHSQTVRHGAITDAGRIREEALALRANAERDIESLTARVTALRRAAEGIRNTIDGYGDSYILPTQTLLDDLAEEYGLTDVGSKLEKARAHSRTLVEIEKAADCDYKEAERRKMSIAFALHAFNGIVDSILAKSKADNWNVLAQKIRDAAALVNFHGEAFRNARIRDGYLQARLDELRWACATLELKARDREEQRRIQAQIKEEERAQREFEQAIRAAEKEEQKINEAMAKARRELEDASAEKRAKLEAKVAELETKLTAAEEKHKRAQSMAELTKCGHVYVISNVGSFGERVFKIGMTRRLDPMERVSELGDASVPFEFDVHAMIYSEDAPGLERELHRRFAANQVNLVNPRKEFFEVELEAVRQAAAQLGLEAKFTIHAEAREYRESVAMRREREVRESGTLPIGTTQLDETKKRGRAAG